MVREKDEKTGKLRFKWVENGNRARRNAALVILREFQERWLAWTRGAQEAYFQKQFDLEKIIESSQEDDADDDRLFDALKADLKKILDSGCWDVSNMWFTLDAYENPGTALAIQAKPIFLDADMSKRVNYDEWCDYQGEPRSLENSDVVCCYPRRVNNAVEQCKSEIMGDCVDSRHPPEVD